MRKIMIYFSAEMSSDLLFWGPSATLWCLYKDVDLICRFSSVDNHMSHAQWLTLWIKEGKSPCNTPQYIHLLLVVPHLLFGDADVAQMRLEGLVRLLGKHPVAAEGLAEHRLKEEVRLLRVVHHNHEERHHHDQAGGDHRLPLWRKREVGVRVKKTSLREEAIVDRNWVLNHFPISFLKWSVT